MNLLQRYKNHTRKQYDRYLDFYEFKPHFRWNPFDTNNKFVYDNRKWYNFLFGWIAVRYAFEAWSYWMRDKSYGYQLPDAFWAEIGTGWDEMCVWKKQR